MNIRVLKDNYSSISLVDNKLFFIHCFFAIIHSLLLLGFVVYPFSQPLFLNSETWVFVYLCLFLSFSMDFIYFCSYNRLRNKVSFPWLFLFFDSMLMTICLNSVLSVLSPVLIFIYMSHIFVGGLLGRYKGAFLQALFVSFLFSWVLVFNSHEVDINQSLVSSFLLNNIGFIIVAGLSGFFGHQVDKMQWSLIVKSKIVDRLESLNKLIVENINMGLFILDDKNSIVYSNQVASNILCLPSSSLSFSIYKVFPELENYITTGINNQMDRIEVDYQSGSEKKVIEIFISSIEGMENEKYLILFKDCTGIREMERKAHKKEKLESIGKMAAGIAHELRNPLSSIGGSIQLLDLEKKNSSENKRLVEITLREISRLNKIIGEFLDYATDDAFYFDKMPLESVQVNSILEELLDSVHVNKKWEHITHHFILQSQGVVRGHTDKFKQIFLNIMKNACEAMEDQDRGHLAIETFDDDEWVVVKIKDTGKGIDDNDKSHIYEPFYTKKEKGTGLGLSIVRKLVLLYKGHISYKKRGEEKGTVCELRFPIQPNFFPGELAQSKSA